MEPDDILIVQEILGYLLIPLNRAQKAFVFLGPGQSGKSTLLSVAQEILLGPENVSNVPWQSLGDRFNTAVLFNKLANVFSDLPSKSIEDNGLFKSITGEDIITVEEKHKAPFSFKPFAKLLFSCNEIPRNCGDKSNAFFRRLIIIKFGKTVPLEKRDTSLKDKLKAEADGILLWALTGLYRLIENDFKFSESAASKEALESYRRDNNSVLSFVEECCSAEGLGSIELSKIYEAYKNFCDDSGLRPLSIIKFSKELEENTQILGISKDSRTRRKVVHGIILLD